MATNTPYEAVIQYFKGRLQQKVLNSSSRQKYSEVNDQDTNKLVEYNDSLSRKSRKATNNQQPTTNLQLDSGDTMNLTVRNDQDTNKWCEYNNSLWRSSREATNNQQPTSDLQIDSGNTMNLAAGNDQDTNKWGEYNNSLWDNSRPDVNIGVPTTNLQLDTENTINIAVCGDSRTGKSTFINCVRALPDVEMNANFLYKKDGPAPVGIAEPTSEIASYQWPQNRMEHVTLWDLPSPITIANPEQTYFDKLQLHVFDCLLLLRSGSFTQFDLTICQRALEHQVPIILVLNKGDQDVLQHKKMKRCELKRALTAVEYQKVISETKSLLKSNAVAELQSIPGGSSINSHDLPMYVVAAQSYREELNNSLDPQQCPSLETHELLNYCIEVALKYRQKQTGENN